MSLLITNYFSLQNEGVEISGKQGSYTDDPKEPFSITVTGNAHQAQGTCATSTVKKIWDDDESIVTTITYFFFWADQDCFIQFVTSGTNFVVPVLAKTPFILSGNTMIAAANNTDISGGASPSVVEIDHINIGNYSGNLLNFNAIVIE